MSAPVEPKDGTAGRETQPREDQISNREGGEMMELKEAARDLGGVANLIEHRMSTEADALVRENSRQAAETLRRIQARLEALSRLSLEGGGEKASCTNSTDAPACGAATSAACQSEWERLRAAVIDNLAKREAEARAQLRYDRAHKNASAYSDTELMVMAHAVADAICDAQVSDDNLRRLAALSVTEPSAEGGVS